jgi:hypothetical protein
LEGTIKNIAGGKRHAAAGTEAAIGQDREERVARSAAVGRPAGDKELERTVHGDLGSGEGAARPFGLHGFEEGTGLPGRQKAV